MRSIVLWTHVIGGLSLSLQWKLGMRQNVIRDICDIQNVILKLFEFS